MNSNVKLTTANQVGTTRNLWRTEVFNSMEEKIKKLLDSHLDEYNVTYTVTNYTNNYRILFDIDGEIIAFYSFFSYNDKIESFFDQSFFWFLGLLSEEDQLFASKYFLTKYVPPYSPDFPKAVHKRWSIHDVIFGGLTDLS